MSRQDILNRMAELAAAWHEEKDKTKKDNLSKQWAYWVKFSLEGVKVKPLTLKMIDNFYEDLPIYEQGGTPLVQFGSGRRFLQGCVHDSFAEALSHGHSAEAWHKETTKCLILYE